MNAYTATHTYNAPLYSEHDDERIAERAEEISREDGISVEEASRYARAELNRSEGYASGYEGDDE